jgi:hypothetical protein
VWAVTPKIVMMRERLPGLAQIPQWAVTPKIVMMRERLPGLVQIPQSGRARQNV